MTTETPTLLWLVQDLYTRTNRVDMRGSGQGIQALDSAWAGGRLLVNQVEGLWFEPDGTQVIVCAECGIEGCDWGNWVLMRRFGERVVWIPRFDTLRDDPEDFDVYSPPRWMATVGGALFGPSEWEQMRGWSRRLPPVEELAPLAVREALWLVQWTAPGRVLGRFPEPPRLDLSLLVASAAGELSEVAERIDRACMAMNEDESPLEEPPAGEDAEPLEVFLELPGTPGWSAFAVAGGETVLHLTRGVTPDRPPPEPWYRRLARRYLPR